MWGISRQGEKLLVSQEGLLHEDTPTRHMGVKVEYIIETHCRLYISN